MAGELPADAVKELREAMYELHGTMVNADPAFLAEMCAMTLVLLRHKAPESYNPIATAKAILEWSEPPAELIAQMEARGVTLN